MNGARFRSRAVLCIMMRLVGSTCSQRVSICLCGAIAQLGERIVRNDEVVGSIPTSSTKSFSNLQPAFFQSPPFTLHSRSSHERHPAPPVGIHNEWSICVAITFASGRAKRSPSQDVRRA